MTIDEATGQITFTIRADNSEVKVPIYGKDFHLTIKYEGIATFGLGQKQIFEVEQANVETATIENQTWGVILQEKQLIVTAPKTNIQGKEYEEQIYIKIFSKEGYCRVVKLPVKLLTTEIDANATTAWTEFLSGDAKNVLLDFSYAGYMRGETAPPDVETLVAQGYKVYDVTDPKYGAIPNDNKSDREAFLKVLADIAGTTYNKEDDNGTIRFLKEHAKAIIYFPEGSFILQDESSKNKTIDMTMGDIVLKGAGRDKTIIEMTAANNSASESQMWNAPVMMEFKHYSTWSYITDINTDASIGSKTVSANSTKWIEG